MNDEFQNEHLCEIRNILKEEANSLALLVEDGKFEDMPRRVYIAVTKEISRLRMLGDECEAIDEQLLNGKYISKSVQAE